MMEQSKALREFEERAKRLNLPEPLPLVDNNYIQSLFANSQLPHQGQSHAINQMAAYCNHVENTGLMGQLFGGAPQLFNR